MTTKTVLSLFSCGGGLDMGLEGGFTCFPEQVNETMHPDWIAKRAPNGQVELIRNGFETVFANDIDQNAKLAWERWFKTKHGRDADATYHIGSIVELVKRAKAGDFEFPMADVITGGFPCQDWSVAGKRRGFDSLTSDTNARMDVPSVESRGMLYYWMREVIGLVEPQMFIAENVDGLASLGGAKRIIEEDFRHAGKNGYVVVPAHVMHAGDYGVAQSRRRLIFFGFNKRYLTSVAKRALVSDRIPEAFDPYPRPTHDFNNLANSELAPFFTVRQALRGLPEPTESDDPSQMAFSGARYLGRGRQGQVEVNLDGLGPTIRSKHHGNIEYRRLSPEHGGTHVDELRDGLPERRLTVRECARIQSFPDDYDFVFRNDDGTGVSASAGYVLVGNAVPPMMAFNIGFNIDEKWSHWFGIGSES